MTSIPPPDSPKIWASLITNLDYLPGLLTLHHSLQSTASSKYPLLALYTDSFPPAGRSALAARAIPSQLVPRIRPLSPSSNAADPRFQDAWSKLLAFTLVDYDRVVLLDSDMLVRKNMDELMDLPLDGCVLAAGHACVCNPLRKPHYPREWVPENCAFTAQHADPDAAQRLGVDPARMSYNAGLNGGLLVVRPDRAFYERAIEYMMSHGAGFTFAEQDLLTRMLDRRWKPVPYVYNALKTCRRVHAQIWRDQEVRNVHYILTPKPWEEIDDKGDWTGTDETHKWWWDANEQRKAAERANGILDGL